MHFIAEELTLDLRRNKLIVKYVCKTQSALNNPASNSLIDPGLSNAFNFRIIVPPLNIRSQELLRKH